MTKNAPYGKAPFSLIALALALAAGCSRNAPSSDNASAEACDKSLPSTGQTRRIGHPKVPSECKLVAMVCNYCQYDSQGNFERVGSEMCGVCLGADF
jgi:hypothetical protein